MTYFAVREQKLLVRQEGDAIALPTRSDLEAAGVDVSGAHDIGHDRGGAFAIAVDDAIPSFELRGVRSLFMALSPEQLALAGKALHVLRWAETSRVCGRCGAATERVPSERAMKCPKCGLTLYPRISPAIIVLVRRGEEALLARNANFPAAFYSTLAGFSEIGESLEETLVREVKEEVGVDVGDIRYFGSQPWPFPDSLMIGFTAEWKGGEIRVDTSEIADARFFRRDEELPMLPPPVSIARRLIDAWLNNR